MKKIIAILSSLILFAGFMTSCEKDEPGTKEEILVNLIGSWKIYDSQDQFDGNAMFDDQESFMIESNRGFLFGNASILPGKSNVISFFYIEDEYGEEYSYDGFAEIIPFTEDSVAVKNFPLYEDETIHMKKQ